MAQMSNDWDVMRSAASVFTDKSDSFTLEAGDIQKTLAAISEALENVTNSFNQHNSNVTDYAQAVATATDTMESVWSSGAATSFEGSFRQFNEAMKGLAERLQAISNDFAAVKRDIESIVNDDVLKKVQTYADECSIDGRNLKTYADEQEAIDTRMREAYGNN